MPSLETTDSAPMFWNSAVQERGSSCSHPPMKLFVQSAIVFFGTLLAAALVAVGQPASAEVQMMVQASPPPQLVAMVFGLDQN